MSNNDNRILEERMFAKDVMVNNNTRETGLNNNDLIIGGAGAGKTGGYIYQLLSNPTGSLVVSDTKGLLHRIFKEELIAKGYDVKVLDFVHPERSVAYNPLHAIKRSGNGVCDRDIKKLATSIMPILDEKDPFWERAGIRYICLLIGYILEAYPYKKQTMREVCNLHLELGNDKGKEKIADFACDNPNSFTARKFKEFFMSKNCEKMWSSIYEFVNEALDPFDYKDYDPIFAVAKGIDLGELGEKKQVLFINNSDNDMSFHVLCDVFNVQLLQALIEKADNNEDGRLKVPVRIVLDDFAASSKIRDFDNIISIIRSREISVSVIIQSFSQLVSKYSEAASDTIVNNCDHILCLSAKDEKAANFFSSHLNKPVHAVKQLARNQAIYIESGSPACIVEKIPPYTRLVTKICEKGA